MKLLKTILISTLFIGHSLFAQKNVEQKLEFYDNAMFFYDSEDYQEALFNFLKLREFKTDNANINFLIGMCYLNIPGDEVKAIPYFEQALTRISTKWENSFEENNSPLHLLFYLGNAYRIDNQIDKALAVYKKFQNHKDFEDKYNISMVTTEVAICEQAKIIRDNPINVNFIHLDSTINNSKPNYKAVISLEENIMVYMTSLKFYNALFFTRNVNGKWTEPDNINPQVGSDGEAEPCCLSADGKELYLVKKVKNNSDIYISKLEGNTWSAMIPLNKNINSTKNETHASISPDGNALYFTSDRRGGFGGFDIYKSERDTSGNWGKAVNLGSKINTELNEVTPFITENNKVLYFSSQGHLNMGGYDIFYSLNVGNQWQNPFNVGYPINTTSNNTFYLPIKNGRFAYTTLIRDDGFGKEDIYKIENFSIPIISSQNNARKSSVGIHTMRR